MSSLYLLGPIWGFFARWIEGRDGLEKINYCKWPLSLTLTNCIQFSAFQLRLEVGKELRKQGIFKVYIMFFAAKHYHNIIVSGRKHCARSHMGNKGYGSIWGLK